jgi:hypothetical protein
MSLVVHFTVNRVPISSCQVTACELLQTNSHAWVLRSAQIERCRILSKDLHWPSPRPIVFTDESLVCQNLTREESREKAEHSLLIVSIQRNNKRLQWLYGKSPPKDGSAVICFTFLPLVMNSHILSHMPIENEIIAELDVVFGRRDYLYMCESYASWLPWQGELGQRNGPPSLSSHSPDLSPIEQIWNYLTSLLRGESYADDDQLFTCLEEDWMKIPDEAISQLCEKFTTRLAGCLRLGAAG